MVNARYDKRTLPILKVRRVGKKCGWGFWEGGKVELIDGVGFGTEREWVVKGVKDKNRIE